ncbi:unnamed protein product [Musa acuminata subsp. malaccensis]|uniref:(wild Malaysian banana) hypothetical protein n=1 Tax=Musa acuminata subsp. malaccensis TaxID=214687 RepID=A0A804IQL2_MUSAM|nr:unnamed protein product [Musa acuminata subsp. malaccensis]
MHIQLCLGELAAMHEIYGWLGFATINNHNVKQAHCNQVRFVHGITSSCRSFVKRRGISVKHSFLGDLINLLQIRSAVVETHKFCIVCCLYFDHNT